MYINFRKKKTVIKKKNGIIIMKILKFAIFVKKNLKINMLTIKNIVKEHRGNAHSIYNLKYSVSKEVPIVFHNGSNYNYHFIIKKLVEEFEGQFT